MITTTLSFQVETLKRKDNYKSTKFLTSIIVQIENYKYIKCIRNYDINYGELVSPLFQTLRIKKNDYIKILLILSIINTQESINCINCIYLKLSLPAETKRETVTEP